MAIIFSVSISGINVKAASGLAEIYWFTSTNNGGSGVGAGGSAKIKEKLTDMGYSANRYKDIHAYYVRRTMNSDKVFAIVSHGAPGRLVCLSNTTISAKAVSSDGNNYSMAAFFGANACSGMKFAYFGSCYSATTDSTYGNLTSYVTNTLGAKSALGFKKSVAQDQATYFEKKLFNQLAKGNTVAVSAADALLATYSQYGSAGNVDSYSISGNPNVTIN